MSDSPGPHGGPAGSHSRLRLAALSAVVVGVLLLAAAAFLLSYAGIHHIARQAGVRPTLARIYPLIFDAMLVIAGSAALTLRGSSWWMRAYVWLSLLLLLTAVAAGDALYAMRIALPRQPSRAVVAVTPWVLVLLGFGLWLAMLRQLRRHRWPSPDRRPAGGPGAGALSWADRAPVAESGAALDTLFDPRPAHPLAVQAGPGEQPPGAGPAAELEQDPYIIHESYPPGAQDAAAGGHPAAQDSQDQDDSGSPAGQGSTGEGGGTGTAAEGGSSQPPFDRVRSTPTPPHPAPPQE